MKGRAAAIVQHPNYNEKQETKIREYISVRPFCAG